MELDSLKEMWKEISDKKVFADKDEILSMLQKKSQRPIAKMKRNLRWEFITVVVLYSATIAYYFVAWHGRYWEISLVLFFTGLFCLFYYYRKNKLLNEMECAACEVKSNMRRQLTTLEKYVRFYFISGTALTPICYFVAGLIVLYKSPGGIFNAASMRFYITFISIGVLITILIYFLNLWYVDKLYGQHVKKLKDILRQMEEVE